MENDNWREDISEKTETLKIKDGESKTLTFQDEGIRKESVDYGNSIAFKVIEKGQSEIKTFYVKANNFGFLNQIKKLGALTGKSFTISRVGSKKSDTRYTIS